MATVAGTVFDATLQAWYATNFRWRTFDNLHQTRDHLIGGALMGFGGVTVVGCTIGQEMSALSVLTLGPLATIPGIVTGAWLTMRLRRSSA